MAIAPFHVSIFNYHLDGYAHVNNARYLEFLEAARWDWFAQQGLLKPLKTANLVVSHMDIHYRQAAHLGDDLVIHNHLVQIQSRQLVLQQDILFSHQKLCTSAQVTLMPTTTEGKICRLPEILLIQLKDIK